MSDDWVKHYIEERKNRQRKADMAASGAPGVLQKIQDRIKQDLQAFHADGLFLSLQVGREVSSSRFSVSASEPISRAFLTVKLDVVLVNYGYVFGEGVQSRPQSGSLNVCSDLEGNLQVYKDGALFAHESDLSEVSEFLLRPLLNHIDVLSRR